MLKVKVIQPQYYCGENPDEKISQMLLKELKKAEENSLIVLPEYSNAGGLSDKQQEILALSRADFMLTQASEIARDKKCYVAINVLQKRNDDIKNSTYFLNRTGEIVFIYDKIHLPSSEVELGVMAGNGECICDVDGIRFAFMTCYDVYFNEQVEYIASKKPDIIIVPGYQRGERTDIILAQAKLIAFRCNAFVARASYSMSDDNHGGCSMVVSPEGIILQNMGKEVGSISVEIEPKYKYMRTSGFGGKIVRNDEFISAGTRKDIFNFK